MLEDLRLDAPFEELIKFFNEQNLENMNKNEYMHTPYLVILYKYLEQWKNQHEGKIPQNYKEKKEFKNIIQQSKVNLSRFFRLYLIHPN